MSVAAIPFSMTVVETSGADAAKPDNIFQTTITNFPSLFKTREQNVDANGNIKTHDQGTVNVKVTNDTPLKVATDGSSTNTPSAKTVKVIDNVIITKGGSEYLSAPIDVSGYFKAILYTEYATGFVPSNSFNRA